MILICRVHFSISIFISVITDYAFQHILFHPSAVIFHNIVIFKTIIPKEAHTFLMFD